MFPMELSGKKNIRLCTYGSQDHLCVLQILFQATCHALIATQAGGIKNYPDLANTSILHGL